MRVMFVTEFLVWSAVFAAPAVAVACAWRGVAKAPDAKKSVAAVVCLTLTSATVAISEAVLAWVCFVKPIPKQDYTANWVVLLLSIAAIVVGSLSMKNDSNTPRYFGWGFGAAVFIAVLNFGALLTG